MEQRAERILAERLARSGWDEERLESERKGRPAKVMIARNAPRKSAHLWARRGNCIAAGAATARRETTATLLCSMEPRGPTFVIYEEIVVRKPRDNRTIAKKSPRTVADVLLNQ
jgi:hypothetical protein